NGILSRDVLREGAVSATTRIVHIAVGDGGHWLERRVAPQKKRGAYTDAGDKTPPAGPGHAPFVKRGSKSPPASGSLLMDFAKKFGDPTEEEVELPGAGHRYAPRSFGGVGEAVARNDQAVVERLEVSADDEAGGLIQHCGFCRVIERRIENDHVAPQTVIGLDNRVSQSEFQAQLRRRLPTVLNEPFVHMTSVGRVRAITDLRIRVETPDGRVGYI